MMPSKRILTQENILKTFILASIAGSTIAVNPFTAFDPINLPKMLVISTGAFALVPLIVINFGLIWKSNRITVAIAITFLLSILVVPFLNGGNLESQLWGAFGRSTGIITYASYTIIFLATLLWFSLDKNAFASSIKVFQRTGYFVTAYTLIQYAELDPINWSQKLPFATLGNINFMSAFLGLSNIILIARLMFQKLQAASSVFLLSLSILNVLLIWYTGSIQGLLILSVGLVVLFSIKLKDLGFRRLSVSNLVFMSILGSFALIGSAGIGPLGALLYQETVVFRRDYWLAGITMFLNNPVFGLGIDSYGDYYSQYRDFAATIRTGPQRVSNTAHSIFIDLLSGGGVIVGLSFFLLFATVLVVTIKKIIFSHVHEKVKTLLALNFGFLVFCIVSIGQIGVVSWGVFFCAALAASLSQGIFGDKSNLSERVPRVSKRNSFEAPLINEPKNEKGLLVFGTFASMLVGLLLSLLPNYSDSRFLSSYKSQEFPNIELVLDMPGITDFHHEKFLELLIDQGEVALAIPVAEKIVDRYPRSFFALNALLYLPGVEDTARLAAARSLKTLDPNNNALQSEIQRILG